MAPEGDHGGDPDNVTPTANTLEVGHSSINGHKGPGDVDIHGVLDASHIPGSHSTTKVDTSIGNGQVNLATKGLGDILKHWGDRGEVGHVKLTVLHLDGLGADLEELLLELVEPVNTTGGQSDVVVSCLGELNSEGAANASYEGKKKKKKG